MNEKGERPHGTDPSGGNRRTHLSSAARARRTWRKVSEYFEAAENQEISWCNALAGIVSTSLDYSLDEALARQSAPGEGEPCGSRVDGEDSEDAPPTVTNASGPAA